MAPKSKMQHNLSFKYKLLMVFIFIVIVIAITVGIYYGITNDKFTNIGYTYQLPVLGKIFNLKQATVSKLTVFESSSEEVSSEEPSSEEVSSHEVNDFANPNLRLNVMYENTKRFGNSAQKEGSKEIDDLLSKMYNASNSGMLT